MISEASVASAWMNKPFSAWDKIFDDNMMTVAAIDRLVHHATIIEMQGQSFRKQQSMARQEKQKSRE